MDLRSIINTEASDSSTDKQTVSVNPVKIKTNDDFREIDHPEQISSGKYLSLEYGLQQTELSHSANTYQQNYQNRRQISFPIQVHSSNDIRSTTVPTSSASPCQLSLSSATTPFPFQSGRQIPDSPAKSYQYITGGPNREKSQQVNNSCNIQKQDIFNQNLSPPQSPLTNTVSAVLQYTGHQRSKSSTSTSKTSSFHSQQNYINNQYSHDSLSLTDNFFPPSSHHQHQQARKSSSDRSLGTAPAEIFSVENSLKTPNQIKTTSSGLSSQHLQISSTVSASDSPSLLSRTSISHNHPIEQLNEQHKNLQIEKRNRDRSFSPKTRSSSKQKIDKHSDLERDQSNIQRTVMDKRSDNPILSSGLSEVTTKLNMKKSSSHIYKDNHPTIPTQKPARKRIRYSEPPIWARSIRTHGTVIAAHQNSLQAKVNHPDVEATTVSAQLRVKPNGNAVTATHTRTGVIDPHPSLLLENWEESITGKKPIENMTKVVADFLYLNVVSRNDLGELLANGVQIEIEAKLGELIDKDTNQRYFLPVRSECILAENLRVGFKSSMTEKQHQKLNDFLNEMVTKTHPGNPSAKSRVKIDYLHRREIDKFYDLPKAMQATLPVAIRQQISSHHPVKIRVTHDQKSGDVLAKIVKVRVVNLDIHSGGSGTLDCRISINLEMPCDKDFDELMVSGNAFSQGLDRSKDRLSYKQSYYQIDLTQVTQNILVNNTFRTEKEHELEIEIATDAIMDHGRRAASGKPNEYLPLIEGLLNNVRVLSRFATEVK